MQIALQEKLKEGRKKMGWNQSKAGEKLGCSQTHISDIESGKKFPSPELLKKAAATYGMEYAEMISLTLNPQISSAGLSKEESALISAIRARDDSKAIKIMANLLK